MRSFTVLTTATVVLMAVIAASPLGARGQLTMTYNTTTFRTTPAKWTITNYPILWWAPNQTAPATQLLTGSWVVSPNMGAGLRAKRIQVNFTNCRIGSSNKIVVFPYGFPTFNVNLTDQLQNVPDYVGQVTYETLRAGGNATSLTLNGGECCVSLSQDTTTGEYFVAQENVTCTISAQEIGGSETIPSLLLLYGLIMVFAAPFVIVLAISCCVRPRGSQKRTDPDFQKRYGRVQLCVFALSFTAALAAFIAGFLVKMY